MTCILSFSLTHKKYTRLVSMGMLTQDRFHVKAEEMIESEKKKRKKEEKTPTNKTAKVHTHTPVYAVIDRKTDISFAQINFLSH